MLKENNSKLRLIAHYLPQFHPIPENDEWWGKGFTEWTNVAKAKPLFSGHHQPNVPADLGFYDLRVPDVRNAQAKMARDHGIEGFCYWHYWFAGKRLLERPFNEVLKSGQPDFPFCLGWANQTWTGIWHGAPNKILIEQTYPGKKDYEAHFHALLDAFKDERYIRVNSKPLFLVYAPEELPEPKLFTDCWREMAFKSGLNDIYFIGHVANQNWVPKEHGFDASLTDTLVTVKNNMIKLHTKFARVFNNLLTNSFGVYINMFNSKTPRKPTTYQYKDIIKAAFSKPLPDVEQYPCVIPNWDNTPRSGVRGIVYQNSSPELFRQHLLDAIDRVTHNEPEKKIIFIKSWNEWAEGNYLEPDLKYGNAYLEVIKNLTLF